MEDWNYGDEWESQVLVAGRRKRVVGIMVKEKGKEVVESCGGKGVVVLEEEDFC